MINQKQIDLTEVLLALTKSFEGCGFTVNGSGFPSSSSEYARAVSFDDISHRPSWQEVLIEYDRLVEEAKKQEYIYQRANEYPSIEEQLDTLFHGGLDAWKEQIQAIKDKYPKV